MCNTTRAGSIAAFVILGVMIIHNINGLWLEPTYLGFEDPTKDYLDMQKIKNAQWSFSFTSSGIGHSICGFALLVLGQALKKVFSESSPTLSGYIYLAAIVAGIGYFLTGICDIPAVSYTRYLIEAYPEHETLIMLMLATIRTIVNMMAIVSFSLMCAIIGLCILKSNLMSKWLGLYALLMLFPLFMTYIIPPLGFSYAQLSPVLLFFLGLELSRLKWSEK